MKRPKGQSDRSSKAEKNFGLFPGGVSEILSWAESCLDYVVVIVLVFTFCVRTTVVYGSSMEPTLHNGDVLVISHLFYNPSRGDLVVLTKPNYFGEILIKRVIAVGGDVVDIDPEQGQVMLNGQILEEKYLLEPTFTIDDVSFPLVVPEGCLFVMGDNRNHSSDSRSTKVGLIEEEYVLGRVLLRLLPILDFCIF